MTLRTNFQLNFVNSLEQKSETEPRDPLNTLAEAAKEAATQVVHLIGCVMSKSPEVERNAAFDEAQDTILTLIAAVLAADGLTKDRELAFAKLITRGLENADKCRSYIEEYALRWPQIADRTPRYFAAIVKYDVDNKSTISREVIRELHNVMECAAAADGEICTRETGIVGSHLERADALFRQARWTVNWEDSTLPSIPLDSTVRRDEFGSREVREGKPPDRRTLY